MHTQIEEAKKRHAEFMALPAVEKQRIKWQRHEHDPRLRQRATEIIGALGGKKFDINELEATNAIYYGYLHVEAQRTGYKQIVKGGRGTGTYIMLRKDEKKDGTHTLKKVIANQDWLLAQMDAEATAKDKEIEALEAENKGLKKQLAALKKTSLKDK